jgi:flagellar basal-body rod protein FlgF
MEYGLYAAYMGMRARQRNLDAIANNIANASTSGYKADRILYRSIEAAEQETTSQQARAGGGSASTATATATVPADPLRSTIRSTRDVGVMTSGATDFSTGSMRDTGRSLDVALTGDGFLVVQTREGERYTRAGALSMDSSGQLITMSGEMVVGDGGPITLPPGQVSIGDDGSVSVGNQTVGRLKVVSFNNPNAALVKSGPSLFAATGAERPTEAANTKVVQGALESSNVNTIEEMAAMMQNSREFESLQKTISVMMNDIGRKISSEIGKI